MKVNKKPMPYIPKLDLSKVHVMKEAQEEESEEECEEEEEEEDIQSAQKK